MLAEKMMNGAQLAGRSIKVGRPNGGAPVKNKGAMANPLAMLQQQQQVAPANPMLAALKAQASEKGERVGGGTLTSILVGMVAHPTSILVASDSS